MAEESIDSLITQEISKPNGYGYSSGKASERRQTFPFNVSVILPENHRTSPDACHDASNSRRNSTGQPSLESSKEKIVPHYLRPSTGSCHDFCKYGRRQDLEEKEIRPWRKRIVKAQSGKQSPGLTVSLGELKKATVLKQTATPVKHKASTAAIKSEVLPESIKKQVSLPSKKVKESSKDPVSHMKLSKVEKRMDNVFSKPVRPPLIKRSVSFHALQSAKKTEKAEQMTKSFSQKFSPVGHQQAIPKSSSSFRLPEGINGRGKRNNDIMASKNTVVATKASAKKVLAPPTALSSPKPSITRNGSMTGKKSRSLKLVSPVIGQNCIQKAKMGKPENENVPEKTLHVILTETRDNPSEFTTDNEVIPSPQSFPSPESLSQSQSLSMSSEGGGEREADVEVEIEDFDGVDEEEEFEEFEEEFEEFEEDENGYACEEVDGFLSDKDGTAYTNDVKAINGNQVKTLRKGVVSESEDPTPVKMKFRRGKVMDLQSESNGPRKLRFRRGRVMDENHDRKSGISKSGIRRSFKKKGSNSDGNVTNPSSEKVVLRHQDMQGKKDAQGLLNVVIEETASKLVESRKSKVKALVGAFETVISLQDTKPSS